MAYLSSTSTSPNVPQLRSQAITGSRTWDFSSPHISSDVSAANFISDGARLGLRVGDQLIHHTSSGGIITGNTVLAVGATRTDLSVGTTIGLWTHHEDDDL